MPVTGRGGERVGLSLQIPAQMFNLGLMWPDLKPFPDGACDSLGSGKMGFNRTLPASGQRPD